MADAAPRRACVMGFPVNHSLSPKLHGYWLKQYGIPGEYTARAVKPEELPAMLDDLVRRGFAGCNLTLPLKERAFSLMDERDESCLGTGAVNTVVIRGRKKIGYNSDGFGFMESLKQQHPMWNGLRVAILGAGGAARGIISALKTAGTKNFVLINRTPENARKIAVDLGLKNAVIAHWRERDEALKGATLLVNCTPLGMTGQPPLDISLSALSKTAAVCDIVYRPLITSLLEEAEQRGHPVVQGLPMLLHQGRLGFRHWFGADPEVTRNLYEEIAACTK